MGKWKIGCEFLQANVLITEPSFVIPCFSSLIFLHCFNFLRWAQCLIGSQGNWGLCPQIRLRSSTSATYLRLPPSYRIAQFPHIGHPAEPAGVWHRDLSIRIFMERSQLISHKSLHSPQMVACSYYQADLNSNQRPSSERHQSPLPSL